MIRIDNVHHVSINVTDLERSRRFYREVLCLEEIGRPNFLFPGAWFRLGAGQQLHLIVHSGETLRTKPLDSRDGHFAMRVRDFEETVKWLELHEVPYRANERSVSGFAQLFILDPDRNIIELNAELRGEASSGNRV